MAFNAEQRKINDILLGDFKYLIPRYQRKYVWEEKQWIELLEDIKYCLEMDNREEDSFEWTHFLGSFVFERQNKELVVIDGQQRLTTITLMLCAICVLFNEKGEEAWFKGVIKYIVGTGDMGQDYIRVDNQDLLNFQVITAESTQYNPLQSKSDLFKGNYLENSPQDNVNVKQCFMFFYIQFQEMIENTSNPVKELCRIKDKILSLDVIDIRASNEQESYNIFEILNARGVDLKQHELIKNYIFKYIHPKTNVDIAKIKWNTMEAKLYIKNRSVLDNFFAHYVTHKFEKPNADNTEFRIIKKHCKRLIMSEFLDDLCEKATYYRWFYIPEECENKVIRECLLFFLENNHRQFRPLFLSVISAFAHKRISESEAEHFFIFIRNFYFAYALVCQGKSNTIEDMVYQFARRIENEDAHDALSSLNQKLMEFYPPYQNFEDGFIMLGWSHTVKNYKTPSKKKEVQYILRFIEEYKQSQYDELSVNDFSIEHIANDDGSDSHCRIGNLLILAEPINGKAENKPFTEKLPYYQRSNFITTRNFLKYHGEQDKWTDEDILNRGKLMAKLSYDEIWKLN